MAHLYHVERTQFAIRFVGNSIRLLVNSFNIAIERILLLHYAGLLNVCRTRPIDVLNQIRVKGQSYPVENVHCILQLRRREVSS